MIYEFRNYTVHQGKMPAYLDLIEKVSIPIRGDDCGVCLGIWTAEFGQLNQLWHLWSYPDAGERARLRALLAQNHRWISEMGPKATPMIARQDVRLLSPMKEVVPPKASGGFYELRIYRMAPGGSVQRWAQAFRDIMPVREKYSQNVGIWIGDAPQPNEVLHLWNYPDLSARTKARTELSKDPEWQNFLTNNSGAIVEMQNVMLLPVSFSRMQ
jgi:NIPSNAP